MNEPEQKRQMFLKNKIALINIGNVKPIMNSDGEVQRTFVLNSRKYQLYCHYLEKREIHINAVLERIGLSAKDIEKKRRVY